MLPKSLINGIDKRGLQRLLLLIFLALAIPTAVLIWQAYGQLKWEAYHQHRIAAEELTGRIDGRLGTLERAVDAQSFGDYTFLVVSGEPSANFVQRSPLSSFPVEGGTPGAIGYFQVDTSGTFSTPILPASGSDASQVGINAVELDDRRRLAAKLKTILADNRLLRSRHDPGLERGLVIGNLQSPDESSASADFRLDEIAATNIGSPVLAESMSEADSPTPQVEPASRVGYRQEVFDELTLPRRQVSKSVPQSVDASPVLIQADVSPPEVEDSGRRAKVSDLKLDANLQKKSELLEEKESNEQLRAHADDEFRRRGKRRENSALPELSGAAGKDSNANVPGPADIRISTFESEIDPFEFSLLGSGHFVLFRKVWRDGERFIQGVLVDQDAFVQSVFGDSFRDTALSDMSSLIVAYQDDVIARFNSERRRGYSSVTADLSGELLYRSRFAAPFGSLEVVFSLRHLPAGPGANVLAWVTLVLAAVFVGGFLTLYRLGMSQISLARQQQDFVSAVSHELKSPLTSIRMYGEMLKEGWADEDKRQSYYEFIHDESERLSRLISNVLQLASITRNEPQFDSALVPVAELMSNTESKISTQIERAGFELKMNMAPTAEDAIVDIDEDCFAQIIINLVDNAIKFSKDADNKTIEISSALSGDGEIVFSVRDHGPGIAKDQMKKIFQLFYRSESELTRETVGTGIGLAIVHQLTIAMNGSIDLVNTDPGAEFRLRFPTSA